MKNNLKQLRVEAELSLQGLGDLCDRSKAQLHELEKDTANPTLKTAYSIALVLGKDVTEIWPNDLEFEEVVIRRIKVRRE